MFLLKMLGIVIIVLFALWMVSLIWNGVNTCPACECPTSDGVADNDTTVTETEDSFVAEGAIDEVMVCDFAEGYDSEGVVVPAGTVITGPAVVKPYADNAHALAILPGATYTTVAAKEVTWLYIGDANCVIANAGPDFFTSFEVIDN